MTTSTKTVLIGDFLYGYIPGEERVCIKNTAEQIAAFIMANQFKGQVKIVNFLDLLEVQTVGPFIDFCESQHFLQNELLPVLVPMQQGEVEVVEFVPYVDESYTLKNIRGINEDGKYVLIDLDFFDGEQELVGDEVFDSEEELIEKYPNSVSEEFAGWYISATPYERDEFIDEYVQDECKEADAKELLGISDEAFNELWSEGDEKFEAFIVAVTEKMKAMTVDEINTFAFKHDIWNRVKKQ